ncbi:MAG: GTPase domain-containing protein [Lautropia sp.]|nr:GTPase domain-containing protein [Lautropia sp.]
MPVPNDTASTISLSLVSHTNVGKTTLARTLLSQNVGEIRDEPHVTDTADRFELAQTPEGDQLLLWDTPGFGDSARLARRLLQSDKPIGWFVSQVWDRFADRPLWSSQQAVRNVREEADVVLYLVNAAENPEDASYVEPEMKILAWIGKPIVVLLNQMGPPAGPKAEAEEIERWRSYLARFGDVRQVLALDAFARCWVQEGALLQAVAPLLLPAKQAAFERLNLLWQHQRRQTFDASMQVLAKRLAATALDREQIPNSSLKDQLREVGKVLGIARDRQDDAKQRAMSLLAERLNSAIRESTDEVIHLNGLEGHASQEVLSRLAEHYDVSENLNEGHAAMVGGLVTGALAGLKADVLAGGLTLGGGMIAGGVLGALGGAGLARGYNMVRGIDAVTVTWTDAVMNRLVQSALLTYLAIAHYGRGRGDWAESEHPAYWEKTVADVLAQQAEPFNQFWRKRQSYGPDALAKDIQTELTLAMERILIRLYPNALSMAALGSGAKRLNISLGAELDAATRPMGDARQNAVETALDATASPPGSEEEQGADAPAGDRDDERQTTADTTADAAAPNTENTGNESPKAAEAAGKP